MVKTCTPIAGDTGSIPGQVQSLHATQKQPNTIVYNIETTLQLVGSNPKEESSDLGKEWLSLSNPLPKSHLWTTSALHKVALCMPQHFVHISTATLILTRPCLFREIHENQLFP